MAVAYANSPEFQETLKAVRADYEKAKAAKDEKRMKELDSRMKLQELLFSSPLEPQISLQAKRYLLMEAGQPGERIV